MPLSRQTPKTYVLPVLRAFSPVKRSIGGKCFIFQGFQLFQHLQKLLNNPEEVIK
jgi:hypothetical protein